MRRVFYAALSFALSAASASAEVKQFRDWLAACDNTRSCTAYALQEGANGLYLRLDREGAAEARPRFAVLVRPGSFKTVTLAFDDSTLAGLPLGSIPVSADDAPLAHINIPEFAVDSFVAALRKAGKIILTNPDATKDAEKIVGEISLSGAVAALLWIDELQRRLDTTTALVRRGPKSIKAVPPPPVAPLIRSVKPDAVAPARDFPPAVLEKGRTLCGVGESPEATMARPLSGGLVLYWFECRRKLGSNWSAFVIAPRDNANAARVVAFPYPPDGEAFARMHPTVLANANFDHVTLTMMSYNGPSQGCGFAAEWLFDGRAFQLSGYSAMPRCAGLDGRNWPVTFRARIVYRHLMLAPAVR